MFEIPKEKLFNKLARLNPQWNSGQISSDVSVFKKRKHFEMFFSLATDIQVRRATVLMGPRRVGKTILLYQSIQKLIELGVSPKDIVYIPMDEPLFVSFNLEDAIGLYLEKIEDHSLLGKYIFFDEIQYISEWDRQLKILVDQNPKTKFIVSGSAAGALNRQSTESGAGRFSDFWLPPLTFYEYLDLTESLSEIVHKIGSAYLDVAEYNSLNEEFIKYLNYGGFPEAVFNDQIRQNPDQFLKQDIIEKVILRDLPSVYGIENVSELNRLFTFLIYQTGSEVSLDGLSKRSGIPSKTIKKYIEYLEAAFLIRVVHRVDESAKRFQRANYFKIYISTSSLYCPYYDLVSEENEHMGKLVETGIFTQFMKNANELYYARMRNGQMEVDFVSLDKDLKVSWCLEVKWSDTIVNKLDKLKGLRTFAKKNKLSEVFITTKTIWNRKNIGGITYQFIPAAILCFAIGKLSVVGKSFSLHTLIKEEGW